ncbi:MAG: 3-oxoadipyl-CoA thiolase [Candidatus Kapabacteria bacterium]|nr:3-oxoadipyl-CoA thiolase [Ignavibacteriota bacterium]MCW5885676.1 3-oxoadipyl-CoA thiolase [Candidatus Kapabacteria bacterium]
MSNTTKSAYICDAVRTPIGKYGGALSPVRPDDMAAIAINALINRNPDLDPEAIDDVILGCANQAGEDNRDIARMALLLAGLPYTVPGETVNRLCASGMSAVINASRAVQSGDGSLFIAGGVESMSRAPFVMAKSDTAFGRVPEIYDTTIGWRFPNSKLKAQYGTDTMGETAENVAEQYNVDRESQDLFAYNSQMKATNARADGRFNIEIVPVEIPQRKGEPIIFKDDEFIRPETTIEALARLKPAFKSIGSVTAGNSSGVNDGAAALLIADDESAKLHNLKPIARIVSSAVVGVEPRIMGIGPVKASIKALAKAGLTFNDIDIIELNEAFAAQGLACIRSWGFDDDDPRINPNGGAIALGHPLGMSGARLLTTAAYELRLRNLKYALCTMCIGVGQGYAVIIENVT